MKFCVKLIIMTIIFSNTLVYANEKYEVTLNKCVDGDTAWFNLNKKSIKTRFLAIDTPESTNKIEPYGKEASNFTCTKLKSAKKIEIEYDPKSNKKDKYERHLVWVYVDNELLQKIILKEGLAEVKYLYASYEYTNELENIEKQAKEEKIGMWKDTAKIDSNKETLIIIGSFILLIVGCISSKSIRNKTKRKLKKKLNKKIEDIL